MDEDRKATPLKELQGRIWRQGYEAGEIKGDIYPDAVQALQRWHAAGLKLHVYSSGSVEAQKLIFGHSVYGDLTPWRSEEHTSELQSLMRISYAVFCLKKKKT